MQCMSALGVTDLQVQWSVCVCVTQCTEECPPTIGKYTDSQMDLAQIKENFSRLFFFFGTELCKFLGRSILNNTI